MSDWIEWGGGDRPVPCGTLVDYEMRDGEIECCCAAEALRWDKRGSNTDIVRYRVDSYPSAAAAIAASPHPPFAALQASVSPDVGSKPTNPKDAIGIRKAPLSTIPMNVVAELGVAMLEGASKYGRHNFRGVGVRTSVYFDATMRHLVSFWEGEDVDPDSGLSHITKAIASLVVLRDAQLQAMATDDRPPRSQPFYASLNAAAGQMFEKHADKKPKHWTIEDEVQR